MKTVFGKRISGVCMCTFRVDNADLNGLPFLKTMVELRLNDDFAAVSSEIGLKIEGCRLSRAVFACFELYT